MRGQQKKSESENEEVNPDAPKQSQHLGLRSFLGFLVFSVAVRGLFALFGELAKTSDLVLEYRYWLFGGTYVIGVAAAILVFIVSRPNPEVRKPPVDIEKP